MKWFKHEASATNDNKLAKVRIKYGYAGIGLYWQCLEEIAKGIDKSNLSFELEQDAEVLADWGKMDSRLCEEIMSYMVRIGLFQTDEARERIFCYGLAKRIENSIVKSPQMKAIQAQILALEQITNPGLSGTIPESSGKFGLELELELDTTTTIPIFIPHDFFPNSECTALLFEHGVSEVFVDEYLPKFKLFWNEAGTKKPGWNTVFFTQCLQMFEKENGVAE